MTYTRERRAPKEYFARPTLFGTPSEEQNQGWARTNRAAAQAALIQSAISHTIRTALHEQQRTARTLAERAFMNEDRLGRILRGERWMQLDDIVAIETALKVSLIRYVKPKSATQTDEGDWDTASAGRLY